jgi:hypothetical protein
MPPKFCNGELLLYLRKSIAMLVLVATIKDQEGRTLFSSSIDITNKQILVVATKETKISKLIFVLHTCFA